MLFNGKYYNKPGHLGMSRAELLEKLNGSSIFVEFSSDEEENLHCNKTYAEIAECVENNVPIFGVYSNDNMPLQFIGATSPTSLGFAFNTFEFDSDNNKFIVTQTLYQIGANNTLNYAYATAEMSATIM